MSTLHLNRQCRVEPDESVFVRVVCEAHPKLSRGYVARLRRGPDPLSNWKRAFLSSRSASDNRGRELRVHTLSESGTYEAHSMVRAGQAGVLYFATAGPQVELLGRSGAEDIVLARLNGLTVEALRTLRIDREHRTDSSGLPPLVGSARQVAWASEIRDKFLRCAELSGDAATRAALSMITDATWFIANRDYRLTELPLPVLTGAAP